MVKGKWDGVMPRSAMWVTGESLVPNWLTWLSPALPWHTSTREWTCTYHVPQHIDVHTSDYTSCHNTHWLLSFYFKLRKHVVLKWVNQMKWIKWTMNLPWICYQLPLSISPSLFSLSAFVGSNQSIVNLAPGPRFSLRKKNYLGDNCQNGST